jgi:hypothetical protein
MRAGRGGCLRTRLTRGGSRSRAAKGEDREEGRETSECTRGRATRGVSCRVGEV